MKIDETQGSSDVGVSYDSSLDVYLAVYQSIAGIKVRVSRDLLHWSEAIGTPYSQTGQTLYYPTILGETGAPTIAGLTPRLYFSSFPIGSFPNYTTAVFQSVPLILTEGP